MREGELEVLGKQLLDVRATDVGGLLDLDNLEDLFIETVVRKCAEPCVLWQWYLTWIDLNRARWRAAMSW